MEWYVAYVRSCQERNVAARLASLGIEGYVPIRKEWRQWSDRKVLKDKMLLPRVVFIHCDETARLGIFKDVPYIVAFMTDRESHRPVVIPDRQMDDFRRVVGGSASPVEIKTTSGYSAGDRVRVTDGPLKDMECEVISVKNRTFLCISLGILGTAVTEIEASQIEKIQ